MLPRRRAALLLTFLLIVAGAWTWRELSARTRERELAQFVPALDSTMVRHIVRDRDHAWVDYCKSVGASPLAIAHQQIGDVLRTPDHALFLKQRLPVMRAHLRVGVGFRDAFGFLPPASRIARDISLSPEEDFRNRALEREYIALSTDTQRPANERIAAVERIARDFRESGDPNRAIYPEALLVQWELDRAEHRRKLESLIATVRELKEDYMLCQLLGQLATVHFDTGDFDSVRACYDEGIRLATTHGFIDHSSRFLRFYAEYYQQRGRLAAALDCLSLALRLAEQPGGEVARVRLQIEYAKFLARIGSWDLVERCLRRLPPLMRALPDYRGGIDRKVFEFGTRLTEARLDFATGGVDEANRTMASLLDSIPPAERRIPPAEILDRWSLGLEMARRPAEALAIANRGIAYCDSAHVPERLQPLLLRAARLNADLGRAREGARFLARSRREFGGDPAAWPPDAIVMDVLEARLLALAGNRPAARIKIEHAALEAWSGWHGDSAKVLPPDEGDELRDALTEIEQMTPEQSYVLEMEWRSAVLQRGRRSAADPAPWRKARPSLPAGFAHIVYRFAGDRLLRWTATHEAVVLDTLPLNSWDCLAQVRDALNALDRDGVAQDEIEGAVTGRHLGTLSRALLPRTWASPAHRPRYIEVTPEGPLNALPFAALPFPGDSSAAPIVLTTNVAFVRGWEEARSWPDGRALIVSNPAIPADLARRHHLSPSLQASKGETQVALAHWPDADLLAGSRATKPAIRTKLPSASVLYLSAHHVRDLDSPVLGFVPVAASEGASPDAAMLEAADIDALDLSACRLAILASCSSGTPYRVGIRPGPSLAESFLGSGAGAVVGSLWDVGDEETREFMARFLARWRPDRDDATTLCETVREMIRAPGGASPREWAAWVVQTNAERPTAGR